MATEFPVRVCATQSNTPVAHRPRTANCHEEQLEERYRADNRAQAEHIGTKLAEIDAVIVPAAPDLPPFTLAEGPQGDVECLQGWSTTGGWRPESRPAFLR